MAAFRARFEPKYTEPVYAAVFVRVDAEFDQGVEPGGAGCGV